jgi:hypothetical protein
LEGGTKSTFRHNSTISKVRQESKINHKEAKRHTTNKLEPLVGITTRRRISDRKRKAKINQR